ncbi:MAG: MBL fold metallo-hydrolase [Acidobacteriota bacterium]
MRVAVLGSGSRGNALVIECADELLLVDAGFSCKQIELRLESLGVEAADLSAVLVTHEHSDHTRGVDVLARRYGTPVYATAGTLDGWRHLSDEVRQRVRPIASGRPVEVGGFEVEPFAVPHDACEPVGLVIQAATGERLGLAADLGSRSRLAWGRLTDLDVLVIETNHDLDMLRNGPYPWALKQRVAGRHGHLSNRDAAEGLPELVCDRLRWVVLYHLSQTNNLPALAASEAGEMLAREGAHAQVVMTEQDHPTSWLEVSP